MGLVMQDRRLLPEGSFSSNNVYIALRMSELIRKCLRGITSDCVLFMGQPSSKGTNLEANFWAQVIIGESGWVSNIYHIGVISIERDMACLA